jgi:GT2 family glycosyltransferase
MPYNKPIASFVGKPVQDAKFSILIPTWNNFEIFKICIESIQKNSNFQHQIIVHVNEGKDETLDWVKNSGLSYTFSEENVGVCYAMNAMAKLATTDYILYINDDMYTCPNWDKYLNEAIEKHGNNSFYFSSTMIEPTGTNNKCVLAPFDFGKTKDTFLELELLEFIKTTNKKDWFGASWPPSIVHRSLWEKVGGYSVEYSPGFGSDPDFSRKLWEAGVRDFRGIGKSLVYHFQSKSTGRVVRNNGRLTFATKWGIPSSYFYKKVLKLGEDFNSKPLKMKKDSSFILAQLRAFWIQIKK